MPTTIKHRKATKPDAWPNAPQSPGGADCPACGGRFDFLELTPSGLCPVCVGKANPPPSLTPRSDPFWLLTREEIGRAEVEIRRLAAEAKRLDKSSEAMAREHGDGSDECEAETEKYFTVERERLLLHMLHAASRQFVQGGRGPA
jgi:hypothetical protein